MTPRGSLFVCLLFVILMVTGAYALQFSIPILDETAENEQPEGPWDQFEFVFARLAFSFPDLRLNQGHTWDVDWPKAERQFLLGVLRWTNLQARRQEQVLNSLDAKLVDFPFLYAVEVGYMTLSDQEAASLREYLLRGGMLVVDDFHGTKEWEAFERQMNKVFPDRKIHDVEISDPIFHCFFDINEKMQVPGLQYLYSGRKYEQDGITPHYRAIYDDDGRIMVMINFNSDLGDAWEWADLPEYSEIYTSYAYRLGVNYIIYAMTH
ncbi:MAG: hypothetical protein A3F68_10785 [Acidobacteria bacterium RIFCSPLOWO2_12_FULL_54_10]|nr:MAG: hypothetical protein A3F68_10785 [Acidobacteria bacterium RIFCSPLOWO2_12_FULL_54_10]